MGRADDILEGGNWGPSDLITIRSNKFNRFEVLRLDSKGKSDFR